MSIEPDTKDWTWVLDQPCDECGADVRSFLRDDVGRMIRDNAASWQDVLARPDARERRLPNRWSPLEYGCHLRDVFLVQRERMLAARRMDCPSFDPMGRDERAEHDGYAEQAPERVARQLEDAAYMFVNVLDRFGPDDWDRTVMYNYPGMSERSLRWVAVHTVHEVQHHLLDIRRQVEPA